jgi:hypothetical protein
VIAGKFATDEVSREEGFRQLNECDYLFVRELREIGELTLGLTVTEAKTQARTPVPKNGFPKEALFLYAGARPIEEDATCRVFELLFERNHLISYTVLNESYGKYPEAPEIFTGNLFRVFSWSYLLEFTKRTTYAGDEHPGPLQHYQVVAMNHVVDIVATEPPRIAVGTWVSQD